LRYTGATNLFDVKVEVEMQVRKLRIVGIALLGLLALLLQDHPQLVAAPPTPGVQGPFIGEPVPAFSFNGDVRQLPQPKSPSPAREAPRPLRRIVPNIPTPGQAAQSDPVRQTQMGTRAALAPLQNFDGISATGWYPPDPNGDVGPNNYVQAVNIAIGIYNKTGTQLAAFTFDQLFSNNGGTGTPCDTSNTGDPIVLYDATVDRWILADMAWPSAGGSFECIAVSKSGDPTKSWWLYALPAADQFGDTNNLLNDYPKLAVWSDGYYMSANLFDGDTFQHVRVWALNRSDMTSGVSMRHLYFNVSSSLYSNLLPGNMRGSTLPPAGEPAFFASVDQPNIFHLWKFHVDWSTPSHSTFTGPTDMTVTSFNMPCNAAAIQACVPELNGESVDSLGDRLMMQLQYRNINGTESLWVNHTIAANANVGTPTGVRWYEIRDPNGSPFVYQQGTYQPDSNYRWMGSLAVDGFGNMALGYSVSSSSMYPAIRYAGRLSTDPIGKLCLGETSIIDGTGSQTSSHNRWGDYSAMTVDPVDDLTFWYTNMYYSTTGNNWRTRIGSFRFASTRGVGPYVYYFPFVAKSGSGSVPACF
jgi:hypothetical protein